MEKEFEYEFYVDANNVVRGRQLRTTYLKTGREFHSYRSIVNAHINLILQKGLDPMGIKYDPKIWNDIEFQAVFQSIAGPIKERGWKATEKKQGQNLETVVTQ